MDESVVYRVRLVLPSAAATTTVTSEVATSTEHTMMSTPPGIYHKHKLWSPCLRTNFEAAALACSSRGCAVTIYYISAKCGKCPLPWKFTGGQPFKIRCMILRWDVGIVIAHARRMTSGFRNSCYTSTLTLASTYILTQLSPDLKRGYFTKFIGLRPSFCDKKRCRGPAVPDCTEIGSFVLKCSVHI